MTRILVVDDQEDMRWTLEAILKEEKFGTVTAENGKTALKIVEEHPPDIVILDVKLPDMDGFEVLEKIKKIDEMIPVILLTAFAEVKSAIKAIKMGAFDYLCKPFDNDELVITVKKALDSQKMQREIEILKQRMEDKAHEGIELGGSKAIEKVITEIKRAAPTDMTIILEGESGSGKEVMAKFIHKMSKRAEGPFVAIDCGTLPENLVESELFGYEKGAFTGADKKKLGYFELASGGSLFLDEIANLSSGVQAKLLRVLQEKTIQHLGGKKEINVDVRVIVASNVNLKEAVEKGQFREDLFHRLNEFFVKLPSLRERKEDIPVLANNFLKEANMELKKNIKSISEKALNILENYNWPGNVREMKNTLKRAVLLAEDTILPEHLGIIKPKKDEDYKNNISFKTASKEASHEIEKQFIIEALEKTKYNKLQTAKLLGIDRKSLYKKLKKYNIET